jgi:hypothetical protein
MVSTSSSELATLKVWSAHDAVEVSVLDGSFGIVAEGTGDLEARLAPGIYEVQLRVGPAQERRLVKLEPGVLHEERSQLADPNTPTDPDALQLAVPSAAPVDRTSTTREEHMHAAFKASSALAQSDASSGVVLMVRNLRDSKASFDRVLAHRVSLVDANLRPVAVARSFGQEWATAVAPLQPGGYAFRVEPPGISTAGPTFQPIWATDGWQTLVFVANTETGLAPDRAAVHMTRMDDPWQPGSDRRDIDLGLEAARWSLRQGRPGISPRLLRLLLETKFRNPMLGIIGAHVLLLEAKPSLRQLDTVIGNLANLARDHPDVRALTWMLEDAKGARPGRVAGGAGISWPPMLLASYTAAIHRDAYGPGAVVNGSPAETLAAHLVVTGIWTSWQHPTAEEGEGTRGGVLAGTTGELDPAVARVLEYVDAVAARRGQPRDVLLAKLDERQCAIGAGLPTAVVRRALTQLRTPR